MTMATLSLLLRRFNGAGHQMHRGRQLPVAAEVPPADLLEVGNQHDFLACGVRLAEDGVGRLQGRGDVGAALGWAEDGPSFSRIFAKGLGQSHGLRWADRRT